MPISCELVTAVYASHIATTTWTDFLPRPAAGYSRTVPSMGGVYNCLKICIQEVNVSA